ncbi:polymeric immunoglobulin receptor-like isoform X2 [Mobula birostris]|uniref:polymeric immunoglobulin receptor-like isoform X2 n=1 Tax=Mobula birostris TaxID=1983395 RepID=UPI003B27CA57
MLWSTIVLSVLLFNVLGTAGIPITIRQSPQRVTVAEGETVELYCTYIRNATHFRGNVTGTLSWYKDVEDRSVCCTCRGYKGRVQQNNFPDFQRSSIRITHLRMNDTGVYYCQLNVSLDGTYLGNGSGVTVIRNVGVPITVRQWPLWVTVTEGETAKLNCTFSQNTVHSGRRLIGAISWYKDVKSRSVCNMCSEYSGRVLENTSFGIPSATIEISDLKVTDTGRYYCQVDILLEGKHFGNGTEVTVIRMKATKSGGRSLRWQLLEMGVKLIIFLVINIVTVLFIRSQRSRGIVNRNKLI